MKKVNKKQQPKDNAKKINFLFLTIILIIISGGFIKPIIKPNTINYYENRPSTTFIKPTVFSILNNEFQNNVEKTFADQIPLANVLKKGYNIATNYISLTLNNTIYKNNSNKYLPMNDLLYFNGNLVFYYKDFETIKQSLDSKISNYNDNFNKYKNLNFYVYYIEKDTDINFETNRKIGAYEYLKNNLNIDNKHTFISNFSIDNFDEFKENFYITDHHWNHKGSYQGYLEIMKMMKINNVLKPIDEINLNLKFSGSKALTTGMKDIFYDDFYAYKFDLKEHNTIINGIENEYGNEEKYFNGEYNSISYGDFYGSDEKTIVFDYNNEGDNLLIIGESFDNSIIKLIASHFNKTYSVDLRNYATESFNFDSFIKTNKINKVLLVGNIDYFLMGNFNLRG